MLTKDRQRAYVYFSIAGVIIAAILGGNAYVKSRPKPDPEDGCLKTVSAKTVILLDHSEDIPEQTKGEIVSRAIQFVGTKTKVGDRVSVFTVSDLSKRNLRPLFSYCKPKSQANALIEHRRKVEQDFKTKFEIPLHEALGTKITGAKESPIAQAIIDLSLSDYMRSSEPSSLLIFSDMIEHTKAFSIYKCNDATAGIEEFRKSRSGAVQRPTFNDLAIYIHFVPRDNIKPAAVKCRDGFWEWFFGDNSGAAAETKTDYLPG